MAALQFKGITAEVALSAATPKTVLQIVSGTNQRVKVQGWSVFFDGTNVSAEPIVVELLRQTDAGTMSALTLVKLDGGLTTTLRSTGQHTATAEPTAGNVIERKDIHPQAGYEKIYPLGQEPIIQASGRMGIRCTAPAGVNVVAEMTCEE